MSVIPSYSIAYSVSFSKSHSPVSGLYLLLLQYFGFILTILASFCGNVLKSPVAAIFVFDAVPSIGSILNKSVSAICDSSISTEYIGPASGSAFDSLLSPTTKVISTGTFNPSFQILY